MADAPRVARTSPDVIPDQMARLREVFPEVVAEGRVDWERLRATLGEIVDDRPERYQFTWAGKRDAIRLLQVPSRATLVPCPEESVSWDTTRHVFIEGENLEVLKLLYKAYFGRVKMIYIDPPYNTGNDFVYPDDFADPLDTYLRLTGQKDGEGNLLTSNPETSGRYHSAWLSMMYPRLFLARQLLQDDGAIFVSIDDTEVANLRLLMNEVFGEENFVAQIEWQKRYTRSNNTEGFTSVIDHILLYRRSEAFEPRLLAREDAADARYSNPDNDPRGPWKLIPFLNPLSPQERPNLCYEIVQPNTGERITPTRKAWRSSKAVFDSYAREKRVWWGMDGRSRMPGIKRFLSEVRQGMTPTNMWDHQFAGHTDQANAEIKDVFGDKVFDTPKPVLLIRRMLQLATEPDTDDLVMDFFAGACPTAEAVLRQNREDDGSRQFVCVQLQEPTPAASVARRAGFTSVAEIGKERIRRVLECMHSESTSKLDLPTRDAPEDLGFRVFRLVESSFRQWPLVNTADPRELAAQMELFGDPLVEGWNPERVVAEIALKEAGFGLSYLVDEVSRVAMGTLWRVSDPSREQAFLICLDERIGQEALQALSLGKEDLFVCRNVAIDDSGAANLALQCRLRLI